MFIKHHRLVGEETQESSEVDSAEKLFLLPRKMSVFKIWRLTFVIIKL